MVNMGELFAYPRLRDVEMRRVNLTMDELAKSSLESGDLLFARRSLVAEGAGKCSIVLEIPEPTSFESSIIRARPNREQANPLYLYYMFSSAVGAHLLDTIRRQVAVAGITGSDLVRLEIPLPPLAEQRAIAAVLGTLDDKIEVNRKQARVLEGIARALFNSWFVNFDPVRRKAAGEPTGPPDEIAAMFPDRLVDSPMGEVPEGWSVGTLRELLSLSRAAIDPGEHPEEDFDHFSIPAFDAGQVPSKDRGESIKSQKLVVAAECVLVSKLNPRTPRIWFPPAAGLRRQVASTEFLVCTGDKAKAVSREFVYCITSCRPLIEHLTTHASGTSNSHQRVRPQDFLGFPCVQPPTKVLKAFTSATEPLFEKVATARAQSAVLAELRDALLPRLISGQLRITDTVKIIGGTRA